LHGGLVATHLHDQPLIGLQYVPEAHLTEQMARCHTGRHVGPDQDVTTPDMNVHFLAPVVVGPARADATIVRAGKRLIVTAVDVTDVGRDRLAARSTLSFAVLERR
jgi:acyl-coenzyme A thioesterase PaaI-like protein